MGAPTGWNRLGTTHRPQGGTDWELYTGWNRLGTIHRVEQIGNYTGE